MPQSRKPKIAPEFTRTRDFISRYSVLDPDELNLVTVWAMGTWCFSPACQWPATYPYLYITGRAGSGKTVLGQDSLGSVCRNWQSATGATGPTLFRMLGLEDEETGDIVNLAPTLAMDEIDATFSGQKDEPLRQGLNVGYKRGATIPRASGKGAIAFPVYGPKLMMGIDNGHLPETVTQRSIRIELAKQTQEQLVAAGVEEFYIFDVEEEVAELQQQLSDWAKRESMVLKDYRPARVPGISARQWEIGRSLIQLAHAIGNEAEIIKSLVTIMTRNPERPDRKVTLYRAIQDLFTQLDEDRLTTNQILAKLKDEGVNVPGNSGAGLASVLSEDGVGRTQVIRLPKSHPAFDPEKETYRGYYLHMFDGPFALYLIDHND